MAVPLQEPALQKCRPASVTATRMRPLLEDAELRDVEGDVCILLVVIVDKKLQRRMRTSSGRMKGQSVGTWRMSLTMLFSFHFLPEQRGRANSRNKSRNEG